jgi:hypothetical protein
MAMTTSSSIKVNAWRIADGRAGAKEEGRDGKRLRIEFQFSDHIGHNKTEHRSAGRGCCCQITTLCCESQFLARPVTSHKHVMITLRTGCNSSHLCQEHPVRSRNGKEQI